MSRYCTKCGNTLTDDEKFCSSCGTAVPTDLAAPKAAKQSTPQQKNQTSTTLKLTTDITSSLGNTVMASDLAGELTLSGGLSPIFKANEILDPIKVLFGGIGRTIKGFAAIFKNKKALIPAVVLAALWLIFPILLSLGINPAPIKFLSALIFAQGGLSGGILGAIGGIIGKGMFAALFVSLFNGNMKGIGSNLKLFFASFQFKKAALNGYFLVGAGFALIAYNFMAGYASLWQSAVGISGLLLSLRALKNTSGSFMRNMITSLLSKKQNTLRTVNTDAVERVISGLTAGFAASVVLSVIPWAYTPYCVGFAVLAAGIVLYIIRKSKKEVPAS
ncbi:MAG: zinc ribbon domain-containing protein [Oscillospiraceae bacterium]|nr:zinc ribbon domain-containing protein [Oscillospiraceae bacterium]